MMCTHVHLAAGGGPLHLLASGLLRKLSLSLERILRWVLRSCKLSYKMITSAQLAMTPCEKEKKRL
uniref:Uncharacterized protein n=1 Tax=Arundo donax TaxID=35708 RepID=A0A0A9CB62_ARUDO